MENEKKRDETMTKQKKKVVAYSLFTIFLWASAYPLTKVAQTHFTPIPISFVRSFIAGFLMLIVGRMHGMKLPQKKHIPLFLISGAFYVTYVTFSPI